MKYYANKIDYKIEQEKDGWYSIYEYNYFTNKYVPVIQAKDLEHAKSFCDLREPVTVPLQELV